MSSAQASRRPDGATRSSALTVAIAGATGAVGQEFLRVLEQRDFPVAGLKLLASARSAGKKIAFKGREYTVEELTDASFQGVDLALFSAGGDTSRRFAAAAVDAGAVVVDNSSAFRMEAKVPLVVPEVNAEALASSSIGLGKPGIVANPNCSTIIMLVAVNPLRLAAGVERIIVSTYQAASGAGAAAMAELEQQTRQVLAGEEPTCKVFPQQYAFNLFSHNSTLHDNGYNQEEMKMVDEARKIWAEPSLPVAATCIRVPVMRAHAESITVELGRPLGDDEARQIFADAPGVELLDDRAGNRFPTPLDASGRDPVLVGRIRQDLSHPDGRGLNFFVCGDQIRKGAALNAVQIAELML